MTVNFFFRLFPFVSFPQNQSIIIIIIIMAIPRQNVCDSELRTFQSYEQSPDKQVICVFDIVGSLCRTNWSNAQDAVRMRLDVHI